MIGRQLSSLESAFSGVAITHCSSTTTRTHSTQPWSPPMCASLAMFVSIVPTPPEAVGVAIPKPPISTASVHVFLSSNAISRPGPAAGLR